MTILILLLLSGGLSLQQRPTLDVLHSMSTVLGGVYGAETSDTLPAFNGAVSRTYRWSNGNMTVDLWRSATHQRLELELINPTPATVLGDNTPLLTLPSNETLHRVYVFVPRNTNQLQITSPTTIVDQRPIAILVSAVNIQPVNGWSWLDLLGLPLTMLLWLALAWLCRLKVRWILLGAFALLVLNLALNQLLPWESYAIQPTLQAMLLAGLLAVTTWRIIQRWCWSWQRLIVGVWLITTILLWSPVIQYDGVGYYAYLRSGLIDHDLNFSNEFSQTPLTLNTGVKITSTGYTANPWSVGPAVFWLPFGVIAHLLVLLGQQVGLAWNADGYAMPYIVMTTFASALAGLVFMLAMLAVLRRWFRESIAALSVISIYCGTNLLFYALFQGSYAHIFSAMSGALMLLATLRVWEAPNLKRWMHLGLAMGAVMLTYWIGAMMLIIPLAFGMAMLIHSRQPLSKLLIGGLLAGVCALLVFLPQMYVWSKLYGSWLTIPQGSNYAAPQESHVLATLFGPLYGVLWWTPLYFVGLVGLLGLAIKRPLPFGIFLLVAMIFIVYTARLQDWHGSGAFGMRRFTVIAPLCCIGLAGVLDWLWRWRLGALAAMTMLTFWTLTIMSRYITFAIPHPNHEIQDLSIQAIIFAPHPLELERWRWLMSKAWFISALRQPNLGNLLILIGIASVVALIGWLYIKQKSAAEQNSTTD